MKYSVTLVYFLLLVTLPLNVTGIESISLAQSNAPGYKIAFDESFAYVTNNDGVGVYDITDLTNTERIGQINLAASGGIEIEDGILFIAAMSRGLVIANVSESATNPSILSEFTLNDYITQVCVIDTYAYVSTGFGIIQILDISDLSNPLDLGQLTVSGLTLALAVSGDVVYIAQPDSGLQTIDASDMNSLQFHGLVGATSGARDMHIQGEYMYLARGTSGVDILDISNPLNPIILGNFNDGGNSFGLHGDSHYICVADLHDGVEIVDVSDSANPVEITEYTDAAPHDLLYSDRYAYVADQDDEFLLVDFTQEITEYDESTSTGTSSSASTNTGSVPPFSPPSTLIMLGMVGVLSAATIIILIHIKKRKTSH